MKPVTLHCLFLPTIMTEGTAVQNPSCAKIQKEFDDAIFKVDLLQKELEVKKILCPFI